MPYQFAALPTVQKALQIEVVCAGQWGFADFDLFTDCELAFEDVAGWSQLLDTEILPPTIRSDILPRFIRNWEYSRRLNKTITTLWQVRKRLCLLQGSMGALSEDIRVVASSRYIRGVVDIHSDWADRPDIEPKTEDQD